MEVNEDAKKLGKILSWMLIVILLIVVLFLITWVFNVNQNPPELPEDKTTTTVQVNPFRDLTREEKIIYNSEFSDVRLSIAFNNLSEKGFQMRDINLLESEVNKFKFIYTYLYYQAPETKMSIDEINEYARKLFNTTLSASNLASYYLEEGYQYQIPFPQFKYCFKAAKEKDKILLIDVIEKHPFDCDINVVEYDQSAVKYQLNISYDRINNNYIYKTLIVVN